MATKFQFWAMNYWISVVLCFVEFWVFVVLREQHVIMWSWWWLVVLQAGDVISRFICHNKLKNYIN